MKSIPKSIPKIEVGKKYRFEVGSAEEAVRILRDRIGERAKVLSVKQSNGQGLARFLSSPRLEIVATLPPEEKPPQYLPEVGPAEIVIPENAIEERKIVSAPAGSEKFLKLDAEENLWRILRKAGFGDSILSSLEYSPEWENLRHLSLPLAMAEISQWLRRQYVSRDRKPVSRKIAFFGTPGVGKTTALCKRLANEVFLHGKSVQVLKMQNEMPNPDDALRVFCEILNVSLLRDPVDVGSIDRKNSLYIDLPGLNPLEVEDCQKVLHRLDELKIESRVLVINAAYDTDLINDAFNLGQRMRATHTVFTHLDEIINVSKLWPYILKGGQTPLFFSHGQNVTSQYSEDILDYISARTFPSDFSARL